MNNNANDYRVALNGLTKNSPTADHVFAVVHYDTRNWVFNLTRAAADALAAKLNGGQ